MDVHDSNYKTHDIRLPVSMERDDILRTALLESRFSTTQDYKGNPTYDMAITYVDNQVRRLVSFLEARGILDNTLIVITADHGLPKGFPNRNLPGLDHFYEEYLRIPMSFIHPALKSEEKSGLVTLLDIGPTILDFAGVPIPDSFQGGSLIRNSWDAKSHIIVEHCGRGPCDFATKPIKMCVVQNNCKIKYINPPANSDGNGYIESLFDLSKDTYETQNLKDDNTYIDTLQEMQGIAKERTPQLKW